MNLPLKPRFMHLVAACLLLSRFAAGAEPPVKNIPWKDVPPSTLPDKMTTALTNLCGELAGKRCVLLFDESRASSKMPGGRRLGGSLVEPPWNFQLFAEDMFTQVLAECRIPFVDGRRGKHDLNEGTRARRGEALRQLAADSRADVVLTVSLTTDAIHLSVSAPDGRQIRETTVRLGRQDTSYFANTPAVNRRIVEYGERNLGETVGRGECWDLCSAAYNSAGAIPSGARGLGRQLTADEVPFPGDAGCAGGMHYFMVHYASANDGFVYLHQNWLSGDSRGRKVAVATGGRNDDLLLWRPVPPPQDSPLKNVRAAWNAALAGLGAKPSPQTPR